MLNNLIYRPIFSILIYFNIYTFFLQFYTYMSYMHKPVAIVVSNELLSGLITQREK